MDTHRTLHGHVVERIGRRIVSGEFAVGSQLPNEEVLSSLLGVSRGGLREAVKALAAKGLVELRPRTGTRVLPRTTWNLMDPQVLDWCSGSADRRILRDLIEFRRLVEPGAARLAATRANDEQVADLANAYRAMAEHAGDLPAREAAFVEADLAFHLAVLRASGNELVGQLGRLLRSGLHRGLEATSHLPGGVATTLPLHRQVLDGIQAGDGGRAAAATERLLTATAEALDHEARPEQR